MKWVDTPNVPGPGAYTEMHLETETEKFVPFNTKVEKFHKLSIESNPGPGSYEKDTLKSVNKPISVFASKTPRFSKLANDNLSVSVIGSCPNVEIDQSHKN